jgi:pimeloyl-ACP methyl ester carboxylesterase
VLLAFHGNADLARWFVPWAEQVHRETNACIVIPEYRGYDGLTPSSTYASSAYDARAAYDYVRDTLGVSPEQIVFFGHSLGTAIAAELAAVAEPRALVLQAPFSTARAMAARMFLPGLTAFWRLISRVHFDTLSLVHTLAAPVWVSHGDKDLIIPVRMGREVFDAAAVKGELLIVPGAGHNDVAEVGGRDYWSWLRRALAAAR